MPSRRLEDRIRELCAAVVSADDQEMPRIISRLNAALHEHNERLRKWAAARLPGPTVFQRRNSFHAPLPPIL